MLSMLLCMLWHLGLGLRVQGREGGWGWRAEARGRHQSLLERLAAEVLVRHAGSKLSGADWGPLGVSPHGGRLGLKCLAGNAGSWWESGVMHRAPRQR